MDKTRPEKNNSNRRKAFRIYEQVELFFHKIEFNKDQFENDHFDAVLNNAINTFKSAFSSSPLSEEQLLSTLYSHKNETLRINISSTGISFTCKEELMPYDYLMIRVLLLSSMTVITTCCKVVYIRPSNPFEKDQYPYTIGARFVKLKPEDKERLDNHIHKKRSRNFIITGVLLSLFLIIIQIPDLVLDLTVDSFSFIFEEFIELIHLLYEMFEYSLDQIVEHVFHTSLQSTQTIVFYIQIILAIAISPAVFRTTLSFCKKMIYHCQLIFYRKKSSLLYRWGKVALWHKITISCIIIFLPLFFSFYSFD